MLGDAHSMTRETYKAKIRALIGLPTLPTIALEIQNIMREDKLSVIQTVPVIEQDPSLAMKILKVANSAYYGLDSKVDSLRRAVVIIGMRELAGIVLGFSILKSMSDKQEGAEVEWKKYWEHCIAVGHIAELLDEELGIRSGESVYSLGLLHDIGKLVMYRLEPEKYMEAYQLSLKEQVSLLQAEETLFGINHQEAGNWISERWGLSKSVQAVNAYHHDFSALQDANLRPQVALVQLANYIAGNIRMNFGYRPLRTHGEVPEAWEFLKLRSPRIQNLEFDDFLQDLEGHWGAVREMVKLLNM